MIDDDVISVERIRDCFVTLDDFLRAQALATEHAEAIWPPIRVDDRGSTADASGRVRLRLDEPRR